MCITQTGIFAGGGLGTAQRPWESVGFGARTWHVPPGIGSLPPWPRAWGSSSHWKPFTWKFSYVNLHPGVNSDGSCHAQGSCWLCERSRAPQQKALKAFICQQSPASVLLHCWRRALSCAKVFWEQQKIATEHLRSTSFFILFFFSSIFIQ